MGSLFLDALYARVGDRVRLTAGWARHPIDVVVGGEKYLHVRLLVAEFPILVTNKPRPVTVTAPAEQRDKSCAPGWHLHIHAALTSRVFAV
jgi:hypothetical protein